MEQLRLPLLLPVHKSFLLIRKHLFQHLELVLSNAETKIIVFRPIGNTCETRIAFEYDDERKETADWFNYLEVIIQYILPEKTDIQRVTTSFNKSVRKFL